MCKLPKLPSLLPNVPNEPLPVSPSSPLFHFRQIDSRPLLLGQRRVNLHESRGAVELLSQNGYGVDGGIRGSESAHFLYLRG